MSNVPTRAQLLTANRLLLPLRPPRRLPGSVPVAWTPLVPRRLGPDHHSTETSLAPSRTGQIQARFHFLFVGRRPILQRYRAPQSTSPRRRFAFLASKSHASSLPGMNRSRPRCWSRKRELKALKVPWAKERSLNEGRRTIMYRISVGSFRNGSSEVAGRARAEKGLSSCMKHWICEFQNGLSFASFKRSSGGSGKR